MDLIKVDKIPASLHHSTMFGWFYPLFFYLSALTSALALT